ncbi:MAG TPA: methyl-accepting chemotaxis protein [Rhizobacter sp.]
MGSLAFAERWRRWRNGQAFDLRFKLFALLGAMSLACVLVGAIALLGIRQIGAQLNEAAALRLPSTALLGGLADLTSSFRINQFQYTLASDSERAAIEASLEAAAKAITERQGAYQGLADDPAEVRELQAFDKAWQRYASTQAQVRKMMADGLPLQATDLLNGDAKVSFNALREVIERMTADNARQALALQRRAEALQQRAVWMIAITLTLAAGLGLLAGGAIAKRIASSVHSAQFTASQIAEGRLDGVVVVRGDDEIGRLLRALEHMRRGLSNIVGNARRTAESVSAAMQQIAAGNSDLSARTEAEVSLLQGLMASLEQLKDAAAANAEGAGQAQALCQRSREAVDRTAESSRELSARMETARVNAQQIAEILGLIDSVAHKTNLLALNAAVEAARAGEHGRGFAVVAAEVRTLAQSSSEAARHIRELVGTSGRSIRDSAELARATEAAMVHLRDTISATVEQVNKITSASVDQSAEVSRMASSIQTLEHGTQRNAALVEQMAAASSSVHQHARHLSETMQAFRLANLDEPACDALALS